MHPPPSHVKVFHNKEHNYNEELICKKYVKSLDSCNGKSEKRIARLYACTRGRFSVSAGKLRNHPVREHLMFLRDLYSLIVLYSISRLLLEFGLCSIFPFWIRYPNHGDERARKENPRMQRKSSKGNHSSLKYQISNFVSSMWLKNESLGRWSPNPALGLPLGIEIRIIRLFYVESARSGRDTEK